MAIMDAASMPPGPGPGLALGPDAPGVAAGVAVS